MSKELPVLKCGDSASPGVRIHHGSFPDALGFYFLGIRTRGGFLFLQVLPRGARPGPNTAWGRPHLARRAQLRRCSQALRHALAAAAQRAQRRQARLRRDQLLD